jgi:hypothetical protein
MLRWSSSPLLCRKARRHAVPSYTELFECKGPPDAKLLYDNEEDTIREGVILVLMALEIRPTFVK